MAHAVALDAGRKQAPGAVDGGQLLGVPSAHRLQRLVDAVEVRAATVSRERLPPRRRLRPETLAAWATITQGALGRLCRRSASSSSAAGAHRGAGRTRPRTTGRPRRCRADRIRGATGWPQCPAATARRRARAARRWRQSGPTSHRRLACRRSAAGRSRRSSRGCHSRRGHGGQVRCSGVLSRDPSSL